jgi:hypothetical protein
MINYLDSEYTTTNTKKVVFVYTILFSTIPKINYLI